VTHVARPATAWFIVDGMGSRFQGIADAGQGRVTPPTRNSNPGPELPACPPYPAGHATPGPAAHAPHQRDARVERDDVPVATRPWATGSPSGSAGLPAASVKRPGWTSRAVGRMLPRSQAGDSRCATRSEPNSSNRYPPWSIAPTPPSGRAEPPGRPDPCGFHQDRRGRLRDQGRRTGGAGPRLGRSILRREMSWLFHRCR